MQIGAVVERIRELLEELDDLGGREDKQFLYIGARLLDYHDRARKVADQTGATVEKLLGVEGGATLEELRSLLQELDDHLGQVERQSQESAASLQVLEALLQRLEQPLRGLSKVVKVLLALSFATRVEGNVGERSQTLGVLADNLKELGAKIADKTDRVRDMLETMGRLEEEARVRVHLLRGHGLDQARSTIAHGRSAIDTLLERQRQSLERTTRLQFHSGQISRAVEEIVTSIQFHDITRQQMDHVHSALEDLCDELLRQSAAGTGASDLERGLVADICAVQSAQLGHTRAELVAAVRRILQNLEELATSVEGLAAEAREVAGTAEMGGTAYYAGLEPVVASVAVVLAQSQNVNREALEAVDAVLRAVDDLSGLLAEIELIGTEMKLIAFNAGITAAHKVEGGAGLGVIAESIQSLSGQVLARTAEFARGYQSISHEVRELTGRNGAMQPVPSDHSALDRRAVDQLGRLQDSDRQLMGLLRSIEQGSMSLAADLRSTTGSISIHVDAAQVIDMVIDGLGDLVEACQGPGSIAGGGERGAVMQSLSRRYTMQSERDVHRRFGVASAGSSQGSTASGSGSRFGDNVEMF